MSTYDRQFPHMIPLDGRHVPGLDTFELREALRESRSISARTQTKPFFNLHTGGIFFARGDRPQMGPYEMSFKAHGESVQRREDHELDTIVSYMNLSLVDQRTKDKWSERHEQRAAHDKIEQNEREKDDRRPSILDQAAFLERNRRGVHKVIAV